jgi:localization factor PodJL
MMIKAFPSSSNSIDAVAREAAKEAARRAGLTLGEYLNQLIAEQGPDYGAPAGEPEAAGARSETVSPRLARPNPEVAGFRPHPRSRSGRERDAWRMRVSARERDLLQSPGDRPPSPGNDPAPRLSAETTADEGAMEQSRVRPASVAEQLAEIEQRLLRGAGTSEPIRTALALLERDLNARRISEGALADLDLTPLESDLTSLLQALRIHPQDGGRSDDPFAPAEEPGAATLNGSDGRRTAPTPLPTSANGFDPPNNVPEHVLAGDERRTTGRPSREQGLIPTDSQAERSRTRRNRADAPWPRGTDEEGAHERSGQEDWLEFSALRQQVAELTRTIAAFSPQAALGALEAAVQQLAVKIDASTDPRLRESLVAPVETIAADLRNMLRSADTQSVMEGLDQAVKSIAGKIETLVTEIEPTASAHLRELRDGLASLAARPMPFDKIEHMLVALAERLERLAADGASRTAIGQIMTALDAVHRQINVCSPAAVLKNIEQQIAGLATKIDQVAAMVPSQKAIEDLSKRLDVAHQALAARIEASRPAPIDMKGVETQMALLVSKLDASVATEARSLAALDGQVSKIAQRIDRLASEGVSRANAAELAASLEQVRRAVAATAPADSVQALSKRIEMLAGKVSEGLFAAPVVVKTYEELTKRLDSQLAKIAERMDRIPIEGAARGGAELTASLDELRRAIAATAPAEAMQTLSKRIDILASKVNEALLASPTAMKGYEELTKRLDAQLVKLAERIERAGEGTARAGVAEVAASLEALRRSIAASAPADSMEALTKRLDGLADKVDEVLRTSPNVAQGYEELAKRIAAVHHSLAARLDMPPSPAKIETNGLEAMVRALAAKMDQVRPIEIEPHALDSIEAQVSRIADKIDRSDEGLISLASLQRSILDLFGQLEETRHAALDAAETAARTAARDTLREAMLNAPATPEKAAEDKETAEHIRRQLTEMRVLQDNSDRRVHSTLSAVHSTLEKIAGRLAALNDEADYPMLPPAAVGKDARPHFSLPEPNSAGLDSALDNLAKAVERHDPNEASAKPPPAPAPQESPRSDDFLIEPGSAYGQPDETPRAGSGQASFIAAARRAAQAAAESAGQKRASAAIPGIDPRAPKSKAWFAGHNFKLLIGLGCIAAISVMIIAYQLAYGSIFSADTLPQPTVKSEVPSAELGKTAGAAPPTAPAETTAAAAIPYAADDNGRNATAREAPTKSAASDETAGATLGPMPPMATRSAQQLDGAVSSIAPPQPAASASAGLNEAAQAGNAIAQYELGSRLADGRDVNRDFKTAAVWLEKAATQGLAPAQFRLATLYEKGLGVQRDETIAKLWYQRAGERGNAHAMHNLAVLTAEGGANKPDYATAANWFRKAAELGVRDSQYNLAILYARGLGIEQSLAQSYLWFSLAAAQGDEDAAKKRDEVAARIDPKSLEAAKSLVIQFQAKVPDPSANEVASPAAGWGAIGTKAEPKPSARMPAKPKVSRL